MTMTTPCPCLIQYNPRGLEDHDYFHGYDAYGLPGPVSREHAQTYRHKDQALACYANDGASFGFLDRSISVIDMKTGRRI